MTPCRYGSEKRYISDVVQRRISGDWWSFNASNIDKNFTGSNSWVKYLWKEMTGSDGGNGGCGCRQ